MRGIWNFLKKVFGFFLSPRAEKIAKDAAEIIPAALVFVKKIADMTPTRRDDEMVAVAEKFGMEKYLKSWLAMPVDKRGIALLQAAIELLEREYPSTPTRVLVLAVQAAFINWKED